MSKVGASRTRKVNSQLLARRIARLCLEKKGSDVAILDLRELSAACDFFVLASAESEPQVKAIADHVEEKLDAVGERPWHIEGRRQRRWILIDCVSVVTHVMHRETRDYYMLEKLWSDAPATAVKDRPRRSPAMSATKKRSEPQGS